METVELNLSAVEHDLISGMSTADAALELCRIHLRRVHPGVTFITPSRGADLRVRVPAGPEFDLEVKGTEKTGVAWSQFKVSSQQSHDLLVKGIPLYRITEIGSRQVKIFIMKHGADFEMAHEPRWSVHPPRKLNAG
jgi:hypothetical protein